jgi:hypothetical protein
VSYASKRAATNDVAGIVAVTFKVFFFVARLVLIVYAVVIFVVGLVIFEGCRWLYAKARNRRYQRRIHLPGQPRSTGSPTKTAGPVTPQPLPPIPMPNYPGMAEFAAASPVPVQPILTAAQTVLPQVPPAITTSVVPVQIGPASQPATTIELVAAWGTTALSLGMMLPWAIAAQRGKPNRVPIALISLLAGWVVPLAMACRSDEIRTATPLTVPPGWYPDPTGPSGQRYWAGQAWTAHTAP